MAAEAPAWWPDWRGECCVIVASGPSACNVPLEAGRGRARFLVVNSSWRLAPWADVLYGTDFAWWQKFGGVPRFAGLKLCADQQIAHHPSFGAHRVLVVRHQDRLLVDRFGEIGWGGNSGFGALNLAVQFRATRIILVGFDMRLDRGLHWHGVHPGPLNNPKIDKAERWRRVVDEAAPMLERLGVTVLNASPVSALSSYPKVDFETAIANRPISEPIERAAEAAAAAGENGYDDSVGGSRG